MGMVGNLWKESKVRDPVLPFRWSGYGGADDLFRSRSVGYDHHLVKPFRPDDLVALLEKAETVSENQESGREQDTSKGENLPEWIE